MFLRYTFPPKLDRFLYLCNKDFTFSFHFFSEFIELYFTYGKTQPFRVYNSVFLVILPSGKTTITNCFYVWLERDVLYRINPCLDSPSASQDSNIFSHYQQIITTKGWMPIFIWKGSADIKTIANTAMYIQFYILINL